MRRTALFLLLMSGASVLRAQTLTDTVRLAPVEIGASRLGAFDVGTKVQVMDSATLERYRSTDLGRLLAQESPVFVKSYGLGSLATTSFRGGSASHTAILWNGFNLGSPMNGQLDLSLLPVFAAGQVSLQYGGSSALWGSGAVSGTIQLNSPPRFGEGAVVDAGLSFGSFGDRRQQARIGLANDRWAGSLALYNADARNDFAFVDREAVGRPTRRQRNAAFRQQGLLAEVHGRITERQRISLRYWGQESDRRIPPTLLQVLSTARQVDEGHRLAAEWQRTGDRVVWMARTAWFDERLDWYAWDTATAAVSRSRTSITEGEMRFRPGPRHALDIGVNNTWTEAVSDGYPQGPQQDRVALYAAYRYDPHTRWTASLAARQELLDGRAVPFTASVGAACRITSGLSLKANAAKVYRVPTLNDRYWDPGGDPDLRAEHGYSGDLGLAWTAGRGRHAWRTEVTWFNKLIDDWIIWQPGPAYWSPRNVQQVWSRGIETNSEVSARVRTCTVKLSAITNYVVSTGQKATGPNDASVDKQLIYVPMYSSSGRLSLLWRRLTLSCASTYTGYRYTSTDGRDFLPPYTLASATVSYRFAVKRTCIVSAFVQGDNLFNTEYQVMLDRPMPLRNYQAGVSIRFQRPHDPLP